MHVNRNDAYPQATYDAEGKLVPLPDESEENTAAREAVVLYGAGHTNNHPRDVFPDYDPNTASGDEPTVAQTQVNDVFAQKGGARREGPGPSGQGVQGNMGGPSGSQGAQAQGGPSVGAGRPSEPDATRDDGKGGSAKLPYGKKEYEVPVNAGEQDASHAHSVDSPQAYDPGSKKEQDQEGNPISEDDQDEIDDDDDDGEGEIDETPEEAIKRAKEARRARENESASPRNPPDNESPRDRREREKREREERLRKRK